MDNLNKIDERMRQKLLYESYKDARCPVCGYYCLGKGGIGCIDKPALCGLKNDTQISRSKEKGEKMKKKNERSRVEIVIDSILEGGYTEGELYEIIDTCEEELENIDKE